MKLRIRNFAKISKADIEIDGITIIAGNNNTGKSTIGKSLDAVFNATYNMDEKMNRARVRSLAYMLRNEVENSKGRINGHRNFYYDYQNLASRLLECEVSEWKAICEAFADSIIFPQKQEIGFEEKILDRLKENQKISDDTFGKAIYTNYFGQVFHEQINSLYHPEKLAEIILSVKEKDIELVFKGNECIQEKRQLEINNTSLYIDDPFVLDEMNNNPTYSMLDLAVQKRNVLQKLMQKEEKSVEEKTFSDLLVANKLEEIMRIINSVAAGKIVKGQKYMYQLEEDSSKEIDVASLSMGLKSFLILKQLLLNGNLQNKDVIVLDEPEIHLHPEWQLLYAEIIVLLQKKFNFHIVVTTHSAHFLEALELYSRKYEIAEKCNYYLTSLQEDGVVFENVTENISKIYKQMVDPALLLSRLREELDTENDKL